MPADDIHAELRSIARWLPRTPVSPRTVKVARTLTGLRTRKSAPDMAVEPCGTVSVRVHRPATSKTPLPALLWIHGGGFVMGTAAQDDAVCRHLSNNLAIVTAAVEYRLSPEHQYPTPLDDCHDALAWLADQPYVDSNRIAVGGASAGGGLAAALALLSLERRDVQPVFQLLAYPMLDDRTAARTDVDETGYRLWSNKANRFAWQAYTGRTPGSPDVSPLAAPARSQELTGLPPAWIGVGTLDLFHDEDLAYADRLRAAGVDCDVHVVRGAFHGFDSVRPRAIVTQEFLAAQTRALGTALSG